MTFFREHKFLVILLVISLFVIALGVFLIVKSNRDYRAQLHQRPAYEQADQAQQSVNKLNKIAEDANQALLQSAAEGAGNAQDPIEDIKPAEAVARTKALNGKIPEVGTDEWCDYMMAKDSDDWTMDERTQFAKHCL